MRPVGRSELAELCAPLLRRCRFPARRLVCAVSGGADSTALLALALAATPDVAVVHVNHSLRPNADDDAEAVRQLCKRWDVPCQVERVVVDSGPNLEARAREARYRVLPVGVLTGHTADDLVETMLLNLMRGAALDGLAPMRSLDEQRFRPLLNLRRHETASLCDVLRVTPIEDSMNADLRYRRVRVRSELIPLLDDIAKRDVVDVIARQMPLLADDAEYLAHVSLSLDATDARQLGVAPRPIAARAIRRWLDAEGATPGSVASADVIERVLAVARGTAAGTEIGNGWSVRRTNQRLRVVPPPTLPGPASSDETA